MFLAVNELLKEKSRFILIIFVVVLVGYLTFFLTALAYGLATSYTQGIDSWNASGIVLQKDANNNAARSLLMAKDYEGFLSDDTALLGVGAATIEVASTEDVILFGVDTADFLSPRVSEGKGIEAPDEIIVSDQLKQVGVTLDQTLTFKGSSSEYIVVGFVEKSTFQAAPIVHMQLEQWRSEVSDLAGMVGMKDDTTVSAIVTRGATDVGRFDTLTTVWQTISDFSFTLPGYQAQVLTFGLMIGFLITIASFVLAVFMYILTLQKKSIFGVLKAEGISNAYIARSVIVQILVLSIAGLAIGLVLTLLTGLALPGAVPFLVNPLFFLGIVLLFIIFSMIGGIASVRAITKIDPVEAIG